MIQPHGPAELAHGSASEHGDLSAEQSLEHRRPSLGEVTIPADRADVIRLSASSVNRGSSQISKNGDRLAVVHPSYRDQSGARVWPGRGRETNR